uniref:RNA-directed DNA polymerase, eukaryota, reverse transcriptase zinc-binding domain protein n=1 Tax=Tanacetum cinerariifolium TaxID=118510 RepID=A0A6L2P679_TANCI|nr:RNA-directed DNA polymerase, eukaryota, reverse transcriptase zinc-binding domain protein [Tanacetum cinerariifolium]
MMAEEGGCGAINNRQRWWRDESSGGGDKWATVEVVVSRSDVVVAANLAYWTENETGRQTLKKIYDVIITSEWNARELENIIRVLHIFYLASGLKINIHNSNIYGVGVNDEDVSSMAHNVGCISHALPFTYLGLPIGSNINFIANWKMVIDRFQSRLSS